MSDYEDEMDIDAVAPAAANDGGITFSAENASALGKGKRIARDLPVEAEDSLPWVEKYRPSTLSDVAGHQDILATINRFVDSNRLPHLLLYGPPGTGKTSTVLALARKIYGPRNMRQMVLELNASDDRGIDVVREQIKTFASTKQIFSSGLGGGGGGGGDGNDRQRSLATFKLIMLDEADAMTSTAQMALRRIMEKYTANTRFCIIANYTHKLSPALLSRCTRFRFSPLKERDIRGLVDHVVEREQVDITSDAVDALVNLKTPLRPNPSSAPTSASPTAPAPAPAPPSAPISETTVYDCIAAPHPADIKEILSTLLSTPDVTSCLTTINALKVNRGLALADILTALADHVVVDLLDVPAQTRVAWLDGLAAVEYRLSGGANEVVQTGAVVGVVRVGCELMENSGGGR
ncbi:MAG: hypothetical protein M1815_005235 [Lichina confinis]|nr:MAG: hypothetical protein M1815_005235 [Lichina confinis]